MTIYATVIKDFPQEIHINCHRIPPGNTNHDLCDNKYLLTRDWSIPLLPWLLRKLLQQSQKLLVANEVYFKSITATSARRDSKLEDQQHKQSVYIIRGPESNNVTFGQQMELTNNDYSMVGAF